MLNEARRLTCLENSPNMLITIKVKMMNHTKESELEEHYKNNYKADVQVSLLHIHY